MWTTSVWKYSMVNISQIMVMDEMRYGLWFMAGRRIIGQHLGPKGCTHTVYTSMAGLLFNQFPCVACVTLHHQSLTMCNSSKSNGLESHGFWKESDSKVEQHVIHKSNFTFSLDFTTIIILCSNTSRITVSIQKCSSLWHNGFPVIQTSSGILSSLIYQLS